MNGFIVFLISFSLSDSGGEGQNNFFQQTRHNEPMYYDKIGFYSTSFHAHKEIIISFSGGKNSVFIFFPKMTYPIYYSIDDNRFVYYPNQIGLSLEGKNHTIIKSSNSIAHFWIIPSTLCPTSSMYAYGSFSISIKSDIISRMCIFSPIFDVKDIKFKVKTGIPDYKGIHYSKIYTNNFTNPQFSNYGNKAKSHKVKTSYIAEYYINESSSKRYPYKLYYKRKVTSDLTKFGYDKCSVGSVTYCNSTECKLNPYLNLSDDCNDFDIHLFLLIIAETFLSIFLIFIIYTNFKKCCKKKESIDALNTLPLKSDNTYEKVADSTYTQLQVTPDSNAQSQQSEKVNKC